MMYDTEKLFMNDQWQFGKDDELSWVKKKL